MALVNAGDVSLNAVELGEGPPVVMLHGLISGSSASWYFTCAPVLAKNHRVILYDLRGHGRSAPAAGGYDTATLAKDLENLLDAMGVDEPVSLVGHSYGALVAMRFALAHPERVNRLALVEAPLPPSRHPPNRNRSPIGGFLGVRSKSPCADLSLFEQAFSIVQLVDACDNIGDLGVIEWRSTPCSIPS